MAVRLGEGIRLALSVFDMTFFGCLATAGYLNGQGMPYYVMSVIGPFLLCLWHIWSFDHNDPKDSWEAFKVRLVEIATSACVNSDLASHSRLVVMVRRWSVVDWSWTTTSSLCPSRVDLTLLRVRNFVVNITNSPSFLIYVSESTR